MSLVATAAVVNKHPAGKALGDDVATASVGQHAPFRIVAHGRTTSTPSGTAIYGACLKVRRAALRRLMVDFGGVERKYGERDDSFRAVHSHLSIDWRVSPVPKHFLQLPRCNGHIRVP